MSIPDQLNTMSAIIDTVANTKRSGSVLASIRTFIDCLRNIPDYPPSHASHEVLKSIRRLADRMIDQIEAHLALGGDRLSVQQDFVTTVYEIRAAIEHIEPWGRSTNLHSNSPLSVTPGSHSG